MYRFMMFCTVFFMFSSATLATNESLITRQSSFSVKETAERFETVLKSKGMTVFIRINHAENALKVGKKMRPTELIIFGNPKIGTLLMQCQQSVAIDLPQKALIWEDENHQVWLSYNNPNYLAERHNLNECKAVVDKISLALKSFSEKATVKE